MGLSLPGAACFRVSPATTPWSTDEARVGYRFRWSVPRKCRTPAVGSGVFIGGGYGVGLTVTDVELPLVAPAGTAFPALGEVLPVHLRSPEEKALELQRVQRLKAE